MDRKERSTYSPESLGSGTGEEEKTLAQKATRRDPNQRELEEMRLLDLQYKNYILNHRWRHLKECKKHK